MRKLRMSELNRLSVDEFKQQDKHPLVIVLDNVRSLLNVGSVFRTADAFKAERVILGGLSPEPNKEMNKTALGATESINWEKSQDLVAAILSLKEQGYVIYAIEQTTAAQNLLQWQIPESKKCAFIFGNEVTGVSDEVLSLCHGAIEIPQYGTKHSLNISVSSGVIMWEYTRQYKTKTAR